MSFYLKVEDLKNTTGKSLYLNLMFDEMAIGKVKILFTIKIHHQYYLSLDESRLIDNSLDK